MNKPTSPEYSRGWLAGYREAAADRFTIDEVEGYMLGQLIGFINNKEEFEAATTEYNAALHNAINDLRDEEHGLAAHAKRKHEDEG